MGRGIHSSSLEEIILKYHTRQNELRQFERQLQQYQFCKQGEGVINEQDKNNRKITSLKARLDSLFNEMIDYIINGDINLSGIEKVCEKPLFKLITSNNRISIFVNEKRNQKIIIDDDYQERLIEFKILCERVWEDGIVDSDEQIEIDKSIIELEISKEDADRIFNQIKGEYEETVFDEKVESNQPDIFDKIIIIDNVSFHFKIIDQPMSPLFWHKYENSIEIIYINKTHHQYKDLNTNLLCNIAATLCKTKLSFSDESGELFVNRFNNYLNLISLKQ